MRAKNAGVQLVGHHMAQQSALFNANQVSALHQYADNVVCPGDSDLCNILAGTLFTLDR
jgi:hypothetical protein